jgi:hypothetical protein
MAAVLSMTGYAAVQASIGGAPMGNAASAAVALGSSGTARLINIATRVALGGAAGTPIPGFVLSGTGTKQMLVRAVGPPYCWPVSRPR